MQLSNFLYNLFRQFFAEIISLYNSCNFPRNRKKKTINIQKIKIKIPIKSLFTPFARTNSQITLVGLSTLKILVVGILGCCRKRVKGKRVHKLRHEMQKPSTLPAWYRLRTCAVTWPICSRHPYRRRPRRR